MEATSIYTMEYIQRMAFTIWFKGLDVSEANNAFDVFMNEIENMIMCHYFLGSVFDTPFWEFAKKRGEDKMRLAMKDETFLKLIEATKQVNHKNRNIVHAYGTWSDVSWKQNFEKMKLYDKLETLR